MWFLRFFDCGSGIEKLMYKNLTSNVIVVDGCMEIVDQDLEMWQFGILKFYCPCVGFLA